MKQEEETVYNAAKYGVHNTREEQTETVTAILKETEQVVIWVKARRQI
jgi:hypothetical protein